MNWREIFDALLVAESEADALGVLTRFDLMDERYWRFLGGENSDNNFSIVGNQHSEATGALVEKVINAIDAKLMAACFEHGVDPEGEEAPGSMREAVEQFFGIADGRLGDLLQRGGRDTTLGDLARGIHLVAVGSKDSPSYLIVDDGEGQTPQSFPDTFMSLARSNKMRIPFVQGKFNSGGTGVLQFCGQENFQLIASRRHPSAPVDPSDGSGDRWGFTLVRRVWPEPGDQRRSSMYVYLASDGEVPSFEAESIAVLPGKDATQQPAPYSEPLSHGTVVKLYNYRWKGRSIATTDARFEVEKYLHAPALPLRITETRDYSANYFSTTVAGIWASIEADEGLDERRRVEPGFPASGTLALDGVGDLAYKIVVFKDDVKERRIPKGVVFSVNGQVHGQLPSDFVSRKLEFEYLKSHLLVSVDCTTMLPRAREDFFPAARDRLRRNEVYDAIYSGLASDLKGHPGLKSLNASRRSRRLQKALTDQEDIVKTLTDLLNADPALRALFDLGDRLVTTVGPVESEHYEGRRFPTYFRIQNEPKRGLAKRCPVNRACRVVFETDAVNDYFDRSQSPGKLLTSGDASLSKSHLWNGLFTTNWAPPDSASPGDTIEVAVVVSDPAREGDGKLPFVSAFTVEVLPAEAKSTQPGTPPTKKGPKGDRSKAPRLDLPNIVTVQKDAWATFDPALTEHDAIRVAPSGDGSYDYTINLDNEYLLTELSKAKDADKDLVVHWFKYGLAISAMGMIQHNKRLNGSGPNANGSAVGLDHINVGVNGLGSVIVPIIRSLHRGVPG